MDKITEDNEYIVLYEKYYNQPEQLADELSKLDDSPALQIIFIQLGDIYLEKWEECIICNENTDDILDYYYTFFTYLEVVSKVKDADLTGVYLHGLLSGYLYDKVDKRLLSSIIELIQNLEHDRRFAALNYINLFLEMTNLFIACQYMQLKKDFYIQLYDELEIVIENFIPEGSDAYNEFYFHYCTIEILLLDQEKDIYSFQEALNEFELIKEYGSKWHNILCDYYIGCFYFDNNEYTKCLEILISRIDDLCDNLPYNLCAFLMERIMYSYYNLKNYSESKVYALIIIEEYFESKLIYLDALILLSDVYFLEKDVRRHHDAGMKLINGYEAYFGISTGLIQICVEIGFQFCDFSNYTHAEEVFKKAKACAGKIYGEDNGIMDYFGRTDSIFYFQDGDYINAKSVLEKAYTFIYNLQETDDDFIMSIYQQKENLLRELEQRLLVINSDLDDETQSDMDRYLSLFIHNDKKSIDNFVREVLHYPKEFIERIYSDNINVNKKVLGITEKLTAIKGFWDLINYFTLNESVFTQEKIDSMPDSERAYHANKVFESYFNFISLLDEDSHIYEMINSRVYDWAFMMAEGNLRMNEPFKALEIVEKYGEHLRSSAGELAWNVTECLVFDALGDKCKVTKKLDEIINLQEKLIINIIVLKEEDKQRQFLEQFYIRNSLQKILYLVIKYKDMDFAYSYLLKNKVLTLDYIKLLRGHQYSSLNDEPINLYEQLFEINYRDVYKRIDDTSVIIEFTKVWYQVDKICYTAFIVNNRGDIQVISIGDVCRINELIELFMNSLFKSSVFCDYNIHNEVEGYNTLYEALYVPIAKKIDKRINKLIIAPEGKLFQIPFELFFVNYDTVYTYSGKEVNNEKPGFKRKIQKPLIVGNPTSYGRQDLKAAQDEAIIVSDILHAVPYLGGQAVKDIFCNKYDLIHIASHADYIDEKIGWMSSGKLYLSGDETITSDEISNMDYSNVHLTVLSACDTGKGKEFCHEGVLGLGRAFANAGVHNLIVSLWKLDDISAVLFMRYFYNEWQNKNNSISESLRLSKQYIRDLTVKELRDWLSGIVSEEGEIDNYKSLLIELEDKENDMKYYAHPYYWASYINFNFRDNGKER